MPPQHLDEIHTEKTFFTFLSENDTIIDMPNHKGGNLLGAKIVNLSVWDLSVLLVFAIDLTVNLQSHLDEILLQRLLKQK